MLETGVPPSVKAHSHCAICDYVYDLFLLTTNCIGMGDVVEVA